MPDQYEIAAKALKVGVLVSRLMRSGDTQGERDAFSRSAMSVLRLLHASGPMSVDRLAEMPLRSQLPVQSVLDDMAEAGLVTLEPPQDGGGGSRRVALTDAGREVYGARQALLAAPLAEALQSLPEQDLRLLHEAAALLERLSAAGDGAEPATPS